VSATDNEARVMKMADGGFRPAFNAQLAVDAETQIIAAVELTNADTDMQQMAPMHTQLRQRYGRTPAQWLADGGFAKLEHIKALDTVGTKPYVPVPASRNPTIDTHQPKGGDSVAVAQWRAHGHRRSSRHLQGARGQCRVRQRPTAPSWPAPVQRLRHHQGTRGTAVACAHPQPDAGGGA